LRAEENCAARKQNIVESNSKLPVRDERNEKEKLEVTDFPSRQCQRRLAPRFEAV